MRKQLGIHFWIFLYKVLLKLQQFISANGCVSENALNFMQIFPLLNSAIGLTKAKWHLKKNHRIIVINLNLLIWNIQQQTNSVVVGRMQHPFFSLLYSVFQLYCSLNVSDVVSVLFDNGQKGVLFSKTLCSI